MTRSKKAAPVAESVNPPKPPKKLIPRTAPKVEVLNEAIQVDVAPVIPEALAAIVTEPEAPAAVVAKARRVRKPTREDETVAKHQKVLAEALVMAQAINYEQPQIMQQVSGKGKKPSKPAKPAKVKKVKLVRDSYAMPEAEYAQIGELKKRLGALGLEVKKSELLRGGIAALVALGDTELKAQIDRVERIKTGRPAK
ncbi:MAG: hypothetical protein CVU16_14435 [Betaproteobacteria bacterium HGW-Betaproteobacteria-10]|nr:MAG: hypothetical protein CVU16_14435 [Betaproteobacteria bacterium HGW-Betaproteobacteria-10]